MIKKYIYKKYLTSLNVFRAPKQNLTRFNLNQVFWSKIAQAGENESTDFSRAKMLCKRAFQRSLIPKRSETASIGGFSSGFFKSKSSSGQDYDIRGRKKILLNYFDIFHYFRIL